MKTRTLMAAALVGLISCGGPAASEGGADPNIVEAKAIVKEFMESLVGELMAALETGGPVEAIEVCKVRAPGIAEELSERTGWEVGRTSLKTRNLATNVPDAWEAAVLKDFDARHAAGEDVQGMAYAEVVEDEQGKRVRFMKAIPTTELCLTCHGRDISPDVAEALDAAYPGDQARGYQAGEVRGAFSLAKPL